MEKWVGRIAVVTGASAGIGAAIVRDLANAGVNVVALARRVEKLDELRDELKNASGKVTALACDVSDKHSVESAFKFIEETFGFIHILVNNAGVIRDFDIFDNEDDLKALEKIEQVIQTNFTGLVHCTRKAFHLIEKSNDYGIIINIGSIAGHGVSSSLDFKFNVYPGTKHAVRATTDVSIESEFLLKSLRRSLRFSGTSIRAGEKRQQKDSRVCKFLTRFDSDLRKNQQTHNNQLTGN